MFRQSNPQNRRGWARLVKLCRFRGRAKSARPIFWDRSKPYRDREGAAPFYVLGHSLTVAVRIRFDLLMSSPNLPPNTAKSAEQSLQELVYAVSHDLGASARAIKGFADLLNRRYADSLDADGQNFLRLMSKGATDLQAQLDGLLAYSRIESRGQALSPTDVAEVWLSVKTATASRIRESAASIEQGELPLVMADTKQLAQLLSELLENAIKFRGEEPLRVRLAAERVESATTDSRAIWLFRLTDNGRGLAPQHLARVFQMFQRCHSDVPGVGAGLAVTQRIVQRHGGMIWAESTVGAGTSICFTLPAVA